MSWPLPSLLIQYVIIVLFDAMSTDKENNVL
jgi:hypothetical protein